MKKLLYNKIADLYASGDINMEAAIELTNLIDEWQKKKTITNMKTLQELQPLIIEWAKEKKLIKSENAPKQRLKLIEECGELASAILKNDIKEQKDAIGDIFVVLVILAEQTNSWNLEKLLFSERSVFQIDYNLQLICFCPNIVSNAFDLLNDSSIILNHDLTECANLAWNEIKDRKGKTVNGTFIKNE